MVVAAMGLLFSIAFVILGSLRFKNEDIQKLRDARRVSDINQIRTGLDVFLSSAGGYPDSHSWVTGQTIGCGKSTILQVPKETLQGNSYVYKSKGSGSISQNCNVKVWSDYSLEFQTERKSYLGSAGIYCMTPNKGIAVGSCP